MKKVLALLIFGLTSLLSAGQSNGISALQNTLYQGDGQQSNFQNRPSTQSATNNQKSDAYSSQNNDLNRAVAHKMPSDQEITQKVNAVLKTSQFSRGAQKVSVDVNNGVVTIRGTIATSEEKTALGFALKDVNGVKRVHNYLAVSQTPALTRYEMTAK